MPNTNIQSAVAITPAAGVPGQLYDTDFADIETRIATTAIPFGSLVSILGENCFVPALTTDVTANLIGVALLDANKPSGGSLFSTAANSGYQIGDPVRVMRKGRAWVTPEEGTAVAGFGPFARFTVNAALVPGGIRSDVDAGKAVAIPHASYLTGMLGSVAVLELDRK